MPILVDQTNGARAQSYAGLQATIAKRLGRTNLADVIPDWIALGESRLYFGTRDDMVTVAGLRLRAMLAIETVSLSALPAGFLSVERITVPGFNGKPRALLYQTPAEFADKAPCAEPLYYTLQDGAICVQGGTPAVFTLSYYRRFPALTESADTNWLLDNCPAAYLYSALVEAAAALKDEARLALYTRMYASAVNGLIDSDMAEKYSGSVLTIGSAR